MFVLPPRAVRAIVVVLIALAAIASPSASRIAAAQAKPFVVTGVSGRYMRTYPQDVMYGVITFQVQNTSSTTQTLYTGGSCGVFRYPDLWEDGIYAEGTCDPPYPSVTTVGAGQTVAIAFAVYTIENPNAGNISFNFWSASGQVTAVATRVSWTGTTITPSIIESTYTPVAWDYGTLSVSPGARATQFALYNSGNADGVFTFGTPSCTGSISACSVNPATISIAAGGIGYFNLQFTAGAAGQTGHVSITVSAPPRASGLVEQATTTASYSISDLIAPTITLSPAGWYDPSEDTFAPVPLATRQSIGVDVCDRDGVVGTPSVQLGGVAVSPSSVSTTTVTGCATAKHAVFGVPFQSGRNVVTAGVSDGFHTTTITQVYQYDDTPDHRASVTPAHSAPTIQSNRVATDTFFVTNPGWHAVQYALSPSCAYQWVGAPSCTFTMAPPPTLNVAPGATVAVALSYMAPAAAGRATVVVLTASYTTPVGTSNGTAGLTSTTSSMLPPQIAIVPANGATIATPTTNVSVSWCDPDDALTSFSLTSRGQAVSGTTTSTSVPGCAYAATTTWSNVPLDPWQHTFVATATDQAGHTTTVSSTVVYSPPISAFRPTVGPKALARLVPGAGTMVDSFTVTNPGAFTAAYQIVPICGAHAGCSTGVTTLTLAPSRSGVVLLSYGVTTGGVATDSVGLIARYAAPSGAVVADTGTRILVPATYTVAVFPKTTISAAQHAATGTEITVYNRGTGDGVFTLSPPVCAGGLTACSLSKSSVAVPAAGSAVSYLYFTTGAVGTSGTARVVVSAPARVSGLVERDSAMVTVNVADLIAPTVTISPAGDYDPAEQTHAVVQLQSRPTVTVDVCDADGVVGSPSLTLNGVAVAAGSVVPTSTAGCNSAKRGTFVLPLPAGNSQVVASVSDGAHSASATQIYRYDDAIDEMPVVSTAHAAVTVPINRAAADTFWIRNGGWHAAHYVLTMTCTVQTTPSSSCPSPTIPSAVDVGAGSSVAVPFTYTAASTANLASLFKLTVDYTGAAGVSRSSATIMSTTSLVLAPTIAVTPGDGALVTTPTFTLTVDWCDDDDAIVQRTITWEGRALPTPTNAPPPATCLHGTRSVWYQLPIDLWQQPLVATAIDQAGHSTTRTVTIAYSPALAEFKPRVVPFSTTERTRVNATAADTFRVTNTGTHTTGYALTATCGPLANCTKSASTISLAPGASSDVVVGFSTSGVLDVKDTIKLIATYTSPIASTIADTGRAVAIVPSAEVAPTVATPAGVQTVQPTWVGQAIYTITNRSSVAETYALYINQSGGWDFPNWYVRDSVLTLEAGQSKDVWVYTKAAATEGVTGSFTLAASYLTTAGAVLSASATSYWMTQTPRPGLSVTPKSATQTYSVGQHGQSVTFTLTATGNQGIQAQGAFECDNGAMCTWATTNPSGTVNLALGAPQSLRVAFDSVAVPFNVKLRAFGSIGPDTVRDSASISMVPSGPYLRAVVSPKSRSITENTARQVAQMFTITNQGNVNATFQYGFACDGALANNCQLIDHSSATVLPGKHDSVWVLVTTPSQMQQSGTITFAVRAVGGQLSAVDTGRVRVSTGAVADLAVDAHVRDPNGTIVRDQCLTIAAGEDAAYECGDLRLVHALPATTTMGRARAPMLIYESRHQSAVALFAADVTLAPGLPINSLTAHVTIDGQPVVDRPIGWDPSWSNGTPRRIVVPVDVAALPTGAYHYTFAVEAAGPISRFDQHDDGVVAIVNRSASQFGPGWWLDGFEELKSYSSTQMLWIGGDGSTRLYTKSAVDSIWTVEPRLDRPDTLIHRVQDNTWTRRLRNHAYVQFDAALRHVATVNSQGHRTTFTYGDAAHQRTLTGITLPVPRASAAVRQYVFEHDSSTQYLTRVTAPSPTGGVQRRTTIGYSTVNNTRVVTSIVDPDGSKVGYTPDAAGRVRARVDRRGYATNFQFDEGRALKSASLTATAPAAVNIVHSFCASETSSLSSCAPSPVESDSVTTWVDGPRAIGDTTRFALTAYGAPRLIVDALHDTTVIARNDSNWPLLPTRVIQPTGHTVLAQYDSARAVLLSTTDVAPYGGADAITKYRWDPVWDKLATTKAPTGDSLAISYDQLGNRRTQKDGRGDSTTVSFDYNGDNQLEFIRAPNAQARTHLEVDPVLGNPVRTTTPLGFVSQTLRDWLGRDSLIITPGATAGAVTTRRLVYDLADRVVIDSTHGAVTSYAFGGNAAISGDAKATTLTVRTEYDSAGNATSVSRDGFPGNFLTTRYAYDAAQRKITETDVHGLTERWAYDAAGNDTAWTTRRGFTIRSQYDTLNRLTRRITPQVYTAAESCTTACSVEHVFNTQPIRFPYFERRTPSGTDIDGVLIPADTARFIYDRAGNMIAAENGDAKVNRGYFVNGALAADTLMIGVYDRVEVPGGDPFSIHKYVQKYSYDLSGRRLSHSATLPSFDTQVTYHYEAGSGLLDAIVDGGTRIGFGYDAAARQRQRVVFGSQSTTLSDTRTYDDDNRLIDRVEMAGGTPIFHDQLQYDQRGKVTVADLDGIIRDHVQLAYNGVGALIASSRDRGTGWTDEYTVDAFANVLVHEENRNLEDWRRTDNLQGLEQLASSSVSLPYHSVGAAPAVKAYDRIDAQGADSSGNVTNTRTIASRWREGTYLGIGDGVVFDDVLAGSSFTRSYYGADEKLRVFQRSGYLATGGPRTTFVEYRYDALGRRVLVRTRHDSSCDVARTAECVSTMDRFVWDGEQILAEFRALVSPLAQGAALETEATFGTDLEGAVRYTHGGAIDQPLLVWKAGQGDRSAIVPHLSWRGGFEAGSYLSGEQTPFYWPARDRQPYLAPDARVTPPDITTWVGSLMDGQVDASGLMYMRNRYYDPRVGKFTQEDPVGLAGGMNAYGFANGDPVNSSDPFGLCPKDGGGDGKSDSYADCDAGTSGWYANRLATGEGNAALNWVGGSLAACNESLLCQGVLFAASLGGSTLETGVARGGAAAVRAGQAGEAAVRGAADIGEKVAIRVGGRTRIPDGLTGTTLSEVKNVKSLSYTRQLRDFAQYSQANGLRFDLWVRGGAELSGPLQQAINSGAINLRIIP